MAVSLIAVLGDCSVGVGWVTGKHLVDIKNPITATQKVIGLLNN